MSNVERKVAEAAERAFPVIRAVAEANPDAAAQMAVATKDNSAVLGLSMVGATGYRIAARLLCAVDGRVPPTDDDLAYALRIVLDQVATDASGNALLARLAEGLDWPGS